jgi:type IV pilus assembly protein PilB
MATVATKQSSLGNILVGAGMITIGELNEALEIQKSTDQRLGEVLLNLDMISIEELQMALDFQETTEE